MSLHRSRATETRGVPSQTATRDVLSPPVSRGLQIRYDGSSSSFPKRSSITSTASSGRRSDGSVENFSKPILNKTSGLPRSTSAGSQARLSYIASTRPMPTFVGRSPPLQAMSLSTSSIPRLDISRAPRTSESDRVQGRQTLSPTEYDDEDVQNSRVRQKSATYPPTELPPRLIPELQALAANNIPVINPTSSSISSISSPSTQFTTSSSPWSASTNTTTPISWSSASPSVTNRVVTPTSKRSHTIPVPATTRSTLPKLPVVKESQIILSSSKVGSASDGERVGRRLRKTVRDSPEPTPPPRSSSLKRNRSRSNSAATSKSELQTGAEPSLPPFPHPAAFTTTVSTGQQNEQSRTNLPVVTQGHSRLQEALYSTSRPPVPSTDRDAREIPSESLESKQLLEPLPIAQNRHRRFPSLSRRHAKKPSTSEPEIEKQSARSRLAKFSKIAIFGRSKADANADTSSQKAQARKGPAAGTGHEGYGKFVRRGRKQSISSSVGTTDSETSIASIARKPMERRQRRISSVSRDQSDLDDFASSRSKPVVMVGGSQRGRTNPFPPLPANAQLSNASITTVSSIDSYPAQTRIVSPRRERFPPEEEEVRPSLATRRSQRLAKEDVSFPFPQPIDTQALVNTPALDSRNTTQSSELPTPASAMYRVDPSMLEKQRSKSKKLKWNIFRRKGSISETEEHVAERPPTRLDMSVNVAPAPPLRSVPWYAVPEPENEVANTSRIVQYLRDAQESPEREVEIVSIGIEDDDVPDYPYPNRESILLPQAPSRQTISSVPSLPYGPQIILPPPEPQVQGPVSTSETRRQPRLAQVGRIPKVVSTRQQAQAGVSVASISALAPGNVPKTIRPMPSHEQLPRLDTSRPPVTRVRGMDAGKRSRVEQISNTTQAQTSNTEFLRMAEMRNSDFTSSSESSGVISIMGPPYMGMPDTLFRQSQSVHDDEVWNEYDDFMDDIMSPSSKLSPPRQKRVQTPRSLRIENATPRSSKTSTRTQGLAITAPPAISINVPNQSYDTSPMLLSSVPSLAEMASSEEIRLRRSRIAPALHASYVPSSPFSIREFLDLYGSGKYSERLSLSSAAPNTPTLAVAAPPRERSQTRQYENAAQLEEAERTQNPTKHSDRQYASLMVSRWLSFGRVLFSPAHQEIEANPQRHVLVIDGLGSEDWSIYCAVTYQAEGAFVHDLKERRRGRNKAKTPQVSDSAPPNHRRSEVTSFNEKFPFPPAFFTAIVVRFPPAMPDSKLKNIVSECRRTLAPGGFLELMVLDLDIVNMGVQTRRAIKNLKIKMSASDRTVSLKPIIDNVQTVLGSNGFSNLNRCVVGVPVVGKPAGSLDSSSESRSSTGSTAQHKRSSAAARPYGSLGGEANFSLNDLVADHSENADAKIGRMVSRTARSWWQHCFEAGVMTENNSAKSILANREVLNECKARAANFKLLIAYTQKPSSMPIEQRRRTLSEPTIPTLATAGSTRAQR